MTPARLCRVCLHVAALLVLTGLILAEFVSAHRTGMVVAMLGLLFYGGAGVARILDWDGREERRAREGGE